MKAITYSNYGSPEVLTLSEVPKPEPKENEVLIHVKAVSINPYDWHYMRGTPKFMRLGSGLMKPKVNILGNDAAGIVESVGSAVTTFKPGDQVVGSSTLRALAEYVCIEESKVAMKPSNMNMEEASGLNIAAVTALETLEKFVVLQAGQSVLINGASGGVGHYTVQIAKAMGADVTGICSTKNLELIKSLGADHVIDYTKESIVNGNSYDAVVDTIGNLSISEMNQLCKPNGVIAVVGFQGLGKLIRVGIRTKFGKPPLKLVMISETGEALRTLSKLAESGKVKTVIDRTYPIEQTAEGMDYLEQGHAKGKVVITI